MGQDAARAANVAGKVDEVQAIHNVTRPYFRTFFRRQRLSRVQTAQALPHLPDEGYMKTLVSASLGFPLKTTWPQWLSLMSDDDLLRGEIMDTWIMTFLLVLVDFGARAYGFVLTESSGVFAVALFFVSFVGTRLFFHFRNMYAHWCCSGRRTLAGRPGSFPSRYFRSRLAHFFLIFVTTTVPVAMLSTIAGASSILNADFDNSLSEQIPLMFSAFIYIILTNLHVAIVFLKACTIRKTNTVVCADPADLQKTADSDDLAAVTTCVGPNDAFTIVRWTLVARASGLFFINVFFLIYVVPFWIRDIYGLFNSNYGDQDDTYFTTYTCLNSAIIVLRLLSIRYIAVLFVSAWNWTSNNYFLTTGLRTRDGLALLVFQALAVLCTFVAGILELKLDPDQSEFYFAIPVMLFAFYNMVRVLQFHSPIRIDVLLKTTRTWSAYRLRKSAKWFFDITTINGLTYGYAIGYGVMVLIVFSQGKVDPTFATILNGASVAGLFVLNLTCRQMVRKTRYASQGTDDVGKRAGHVLRCGVTLFYTATALAFTEPFVSLKFIDEILAYGPLISGTTLTLFIGAVAMVEVTHIDPEAVAQDSEVERNQRLLSLANGHGACEAARALELFDILVVIAIAIADVLVFDSSVGNTSRLLAMFSCLRGLLGVLVLLRLSFSSGLVTISRVCLVPLSSATVVTSALKGGDRLPFEISILALSVVLSVLDLFLIGNHMPDRLPADVDMLACLELDGALAVYCQKNLTDKVKVSFGDKIKVEIPGMLIRRHSFNQDIPDPGPMDMIVVGSSVDPATALAMVESSVMDKALFASYDWTTVKSWVQQQNDRAPNDDWVSDPDSVPDPNWHSNSRWTLPLLICSKLEVVYPWLHDDPDHLEKLLGLAGN